MNVTQTLERLQQLRLGGMAAAYRSVIETRQSLTADELLALLADSEYNERYSRKTRLLLAAARFRYPASVEEVEHFGARNLDKNAFIRLSDCSFVQRKENLLITGPTGTGKSFLASALGHQACLMQLRTGYFNAAKLFTRLRSAQGEGSYAREIARIERLDLLILDDFGLQTLDAQAMHGLMEIIEDRHGKHATLIASQLPVTAWYDLFPEKTIADAVLDRILHNAHRFELKGESLRIKKQK